jgi:hypothetical protein
MAEVEVSLKSVEATKIAESANPDTQVVFNVNASISEGSRKTGEVVLRFSLELSTKPEIARLMANGSATITGEDSEIDALLNAKEEGSVPVVFMRIYQRVYAILYLVCGSLKIPYPSPGLLKSVHVSSDQSMEQPASSAQNTGRISV